MPALDAPVPIAATVFSVPNTFACQFSTPLVDGMLDAANWVVHSNHSGAPLLYIPAAPPLVVNDFVFFPLLAFGGSLLGNVCFYTPPPFDVVSDFGFVEAPAFGPFPVTIV